MDETQILAVLALRELLDDPDRNDWDELASANRALIQAIETGEPMTRRNAALLPNIFARPDGRNTRSARPRRKQVPTRMAGGPAAQPYARRRNSPART